MKTNPEKWSLDYIRCFIKLTKCNGALIEDHQQVVNTQKETLR